MLIPTLLLAQSAEIKALIRDSDYLVGQGQAHNLDRADRQALADLSSLISVTIKSEFLMVTKELNLDSDEYAEFVVKSYSSAIFVGAERKSEILKNGDYFVIRYMPKADKNKIFRERKAKVKSYVKAGRAAEDVNDFDIALRNYYWALALLKSHPEGNNIYYESGGDSVLLTVDLPLKIEGLLRGVRLKAENITSGSNYKVVNVSAENDRGRIANLNLKYFDGEEFLPVAIKDGKGALYLPIDYLDNVGEINATIDYEFNGVLGGRALDEDVKMVIEQVFIPFDNQKAISIEGASKKAQKPEIKTTKAEETDEPEELVGMTQRLLDAIESRDFESVRDDFSEDGFEQFMKIMDYGNVSLYQGEQEVKFVPFGGQTLIRTIPLTIQLTDQSRKIIHDDICPIVEDGKIVWTNFALNDHDAQDAIRRGETMGDLNERLTCLTFMEYYKTIFALKDIDAIANIFRDDAIIFVGRPIGSAPVPKYLGEAVQKVINMKEFELVKFSKEEYLGNLESKVFCNPFVNIQFSEMMIDRRSESKPVFGIQLRQDYYSTNYADVGYLLLFTDNSDSLKPKIFFRCWQPEKFVDMYDITID